MRLVALTSLAFALAASSAPLPAGTNSDVTLPGQGSTGTFGVSGSASGEPGTAGHGASGSVSGSFGSRSTTGEIHLPGEPAVAGASENGLFGSTTVAGSESRRSVISTVQGPVTNDGSEVANEAIAALVGEKDASTLDTTLSSDPATHPIDSRAEGSAPGAAGIVGFANKLAGGAMDQAGGAGEVNPGVAAAMGQASDAGKLSQIAGAGSGTASSTGNFARTTSGAPDNGAATLDTIMQEVGAAANLASDIKSGNASL